MWEALFILGFGLKKKRLELLNRPLKSEHA